MTISVVVPVLNAADTIRQQLDAIVAQIDDVREDVEVVVADNGSTDGSAELVAAYGPPVRLIDASHRKLGGAAAKNAGVEAAKGEHVLFADADDVVQPGWLRAMAEALQEHPVVTAKRGYWILNGPEARAALPQYRERSQFRGVPSIAGGACGLRRDLYLEVGGFDEDFPGAVDTEFGMRLHDAGAPAPKFVDEAIIECRVPLGGRATFRRSRALARSRELIYPRYPWLDRPGWKPVALTAWGLGRSLPDLRSAPGRLDWMRHAGSLVGQIEGRLRRRFGA